MTGSPTFWATPDAARGAAAAQSATAAQPGYGTAPSHLDAAPAPTTRGDARAGVVTAVVLVLLGAPAGLLWALVSPRVSVLLAGSSITLAGTDRDVFIAGDAAYLGVVLGVGLLAGAVAAVLGHRHGPGVVVGLTVGSLVAAYVASRTGALLDATTAQDAVTAGRSGVVELAVKLRASEAMLGWPIGALVGFLVTTMLRGQRVSSG